MTNFTPDGNTRVGTAGGTILAFLLQVNSVNMLTTAVSTLIGAIVSFTVSLALKILVKWIRKNKT